MAKRPDPSAAPAPPAAVKPPTKRPQPRKKFDPADDVPITTRSGLSLVTKRGTKLVGDLS